MWESLAEIAGQMFFASAEAGPSLVKRAITAMLVLMCLALLTIGLWMPLL